MVAAFLLTIDVTFAQIAMMDQTKKTATEFIFQSITTIFCHRRQKSEENQ